MVETPLGTVPAARIKPGKCHPGCRRGCRGVCLECGGKGVVPCETPMDVVG
jgi:hypothetical protein